MYGLIKKAYSVKTEFRAHRDCNLGTGKTYKNGDTRHQKVQDLSGSYSLEKDMFFTLTVSLRQEEKRNLWKWKWKK